MMIVRADSYTTTSRSVCDFVVLSYRLPVNPLHAFICGKQHIKFGLLRNIGVKWEWELLDMSVGGVEVCPFEDACT